MTATAVDLDDIEVTYIYGQDRVVFYGPPPGAASASSDGTAAAHAASTEGSDTAWDAAVTPSELESVWNDLVNEMVPGDPDTLEQCAH